jgi:glutamate-5-semialdehyde dehydrogenase
VYVNKEADLEQAMAIIINGKTSNISVCNALDKVLIDTNIPHWKIFASNWSLSYNYYVSVLGDASVADVTQVPCIENDLIWYEDLDYKIVIGTNNG